MVRSSSSVPPERPRSLGELRRAIWLKLRGGELTRWRLSKSVALGVFIGTLPLYGLHLPLVAALGVAMGTDFLVAYAASNISIPPMIPILIWGSAELGSYALHGKFRGLDLSWVQTSWTSLSFELAIGSVILGAGLAVLLGGIAYWAGGILERRRGATT